MENKNTRRNKMTIEIFIAIILCFLSLVLFIFLICNITYWSINRFKTRSSKDDKLIEELKVIHYQLLLTSERFKNCHNDFIQELHEVMEEDEDYKDFRLTLLVTCLSAIDIESDLNDYINCLEQECEKARLFVQEALDKYDNGVSSFWEQLAEHADNEYFNEVSYMFWYEHFLLAQGLLLDAWRKDKKGDNSYLYPEQKDNTLDSIL
jgi:hypothetical protein